ncbi:hypothetical protein KKF91_07170 [Myxococcota bacterium]|nr:hypothetical protein [Myxococcota bacterium]MBU1430333.1 hypothetical protein [Myxococcota bacterium]MBU1896394.1 hypothetical protein [Myxococcota bacterium]
MRWILYLFLLLPLCAQAKKAEKKAPTRTGPYLGVQPGTKDTAPGKKIRKAGKRRLITWVGFQMVGQGGRVFIQSSDKPVYNLVPGASDEVVLEFSNSRLQSFNDGRRLDTGWFPTAVSWIDASQKRGDIVRVVIKLRELVGYDLRQEGDYLFLDFRPPTKPLEPPKLPGAQRAEPEKQPIY